MQFDQTFIKLFFFSFTSYVTLYFYIFWSPDVYCLVSLLCYYFHSLIGLSDVLIDSAVAANTNFPFSLNFIWNAKWEMNKRNWSQTFFSFLFFSYSSHLFSHFVFIHFLYFITFLLVFIVVHSVQWKILLSSKISTVYSQRCE